jgi:adenylate cyclase, class 2
VASKIRTKPEIEIKLHVTSLPEILRRMGRIGAVPRGRVFEENTLFDTRDSSFWRHGRLLRLRKHAPAPGNNSRGGLRKTILTAKAPPARSDSRKKMPYKERLESELAVTRPARWPQVLRELGFRAGFSYEKYRTSFRLRGLHLDLDETPVGIFLELEGTLAAIRQAARKLGFAARDYILATYWDLYAADCLRLKRIPRNMVFKMQKSR